MPLTTEDFKLDQWLYLELIKRCLTNFIYRDPDVWGKEFDEHKRLCGQDWPRDAHTMVGLRRLNNIQFCAQEIFKNAIPGDFLEAGVWRGGASIFMKALQRAYNQEHRLTWVADSFEGCPEPVSQGYTMDTGDQLYKFKNQLGVNLETVQENFRRYDLLDEKVQFIKGWFRNTMAHLPAHQIALLRCDGDLYHSTMDTLFNLYPKVSVGGYVIIDDYDGLELCGQAVKDYRAKKGITEEIFKIDANGAFWRKERQVD